MTTCFCCCCFGVGCLFCFLQKRLYILALPFPLLISPSEPQERLSSQLKSSVMSPVGEGNGTTLQYSCLENPMDRGAWWAAVHGVTKSQTGLSDFTFTFMHWRRKWQPTPVFLPGEPEGRGSLVGCCLWGRTESDTTEAT